MSKTTNTDKIQREHEGQEYTYGRPFLQLTFAFSGSGRNICSTQEVHVPGSLQHTSSSSYFFAVSVSFTFTFTFIVIKECIDLEILQLSNEEQELGEECSLASTDHSSCLKTTVKKPDQITVDR